jgi:hypothetical protein
MRKPTQYYMFGTLFVLSTVAAAMLLWYRMNILVDIDYYEPVFYNIILVTHASVLITGCVLLYQFLSGRKQSKLWLAIHLSLYALSVVLSVINAGLQPDPLGMNLSTYIMGFVWQVVFATIWVKARRFIDEAKVNDDPVFT